MLPLPWRFFHQAIHCHINYILIVPRGIIMVYTKQHRYFDMSVHFR